jgi:hypothetical protein
MPPNSRLHTDRVSKNENVRRDNRVPSQSNGFVFSPSCVRKNNIHNVVGTIRDKLVD